MKRKIIFLISGALSIGTLMLLGLHLWIGSNVKRNIDLAMNNYSGNAEEALIALVMDENNTFEKRTHAGIWTLGQIRSEKAMPILKELYHDDPEGNTCFKKHDSILCQYEINKAIQAIEHRQLFTHQRLNK
jgi:hypothetical protein